MKHQALDRKSA